jgi:hypothetical protein
MPCNRRSRPKPEKFFKRLASLPQPMSRRRMRRGSLLPPPDQRFHAIHDEGRAHVRRYPWDGDQHRSVIPSSRARHPSLLLKDACRHGGNLLIETRSRSACSTHGVGGCPALVCSLGIRYVALTLAEAPQSADYVRSRPSDRQGSASSL